MKKTAFWFSFIAAVCLAPYPALAVDNLFIARNGSGVVLSWDSAQGETFLIQFKTSLNDSESWQTLESAFLAATGTNRTTYTHSGQIPTASASATANSSAAAGSPLSISSQSLSASLSDDDDMLPPEIPTTVATTNLSSTRFGLLNQLAASAIATPSGVDDTNAAGGAIESTCGFYKVAKNEANLLVNGAAVSGIISLSADSLNIPSGRTATQLFLKDANSGDEVPGSGFIGNSGQWHTYDTTNGQYTVQLGAHLDDGSIVTSGSFTVDVFNPICFPDWWPYSGAWYLYIGAKTIYPNGSYHIDLYDGDMGAWRHSFAGPINANGYCSWNASEEGFLYYFPANQDLTTVVYTIFPEPYTPSASDDVVRADGVRALASTATTTTKNFKKTVVREAPWSNANQGSVAYMDIYSTATSGNAGGEEALSNMITTVHDVMNQFHPIGGSTILVDGSSTQANAFESKLQVFSVRDLYYFGHASDSTLGTNVKTTIDDVQNFLGNSPSDVLRYANYHPYRFVFLDGCNTANGNWPQTFGIPKKKGMKSSEFTTTRAMRARAFMGWDRFVVTGYAGGSGVSQFKKHATFVEEFWNNWAHLDNGVPDTTIFDAIDKARSAKTEDGMSVNVSGIILYGAEDLKINQ